MPLVTVRFWAAARAAAGVEDEVCDATNLAELIDQIGARHGASLARILDRCSFLVDDAPVGVRPRRSIPLEPGSTVEVLPPFAGG